MDSYTAVTNPNRETCGVAGGGGRGVNKVFVVLKMGEMMVCLYAMRMIQRRLKVMQWRKREDGWRDVLQQRTGDGAQCTTHMRESMVSSPVATGRKAE